MSVKGSLPENVRHKQEETEKRDIRGIRIYERKREKYKKTGI